MDQVSPATMIDAEGERPVIEAVCWGTRGSIASPGPDTVRFGGNTPCLEVRIRDGRRFIFDAGTGIRPLGLSMMGETGTRDAVVFLTHFHWDHIQGFPFFLPLYDPEASLRIVGPDQADADIEKIFASQMASINFPVPYAALSAEKEFSNLNGGVWEEDGFCVRAMRMRHSSFTVGHRIEYGGVSLAYMPDNELANESYKVGKGWRKRLVDFLGDVDVLVHDAMFTEEEYESKVDWGHSTFSQTVELAHEAGAKKVLFFHHDPCRSDLELSEIIDLNGTEAAARGYGVEIGAAVERDEIIG
ncbi:MAG: MBL fold metallo-hydrolase [Gemmatimonadetes bacterium]|nr:MBL fold metallo-hydrolase [Gemmatimonadota bacterium]